ncbi:TIGR02300 family protein [Skermanella sp. TT6]|uniref:TIGR02300 family protein n=1 Tax=Skermanella cutis TaxID=2775420 RepID=A0ABX7BBS0_9PROT|nr:TIGR02300 family protein [Skermanella sp. TT6]QQP90738.1 TIGR02300 family protein [Skermanella sp. TT6]
MAKPEWGTKRICPNCGARYYDLRKDPPVCPSCGTTFDPEALLKSRRARPAPVEEVVKKAPADTEDEEETVDAADGEMEETDDEAAVDDLDEDADETVQEEDDVLLEDASELGDEDDMGEVVDVEGEDEER